MSQQSYFYNVNRKELGERRYQAIKKLNSIMLIKIGLW